MSVRFEVPTQVMYYDWGNDNYKAGIAYGDEIICACCGGTVEIAEVLELCEGTGKKGIYVMDWIDFTQEIEMDMDMDMEEYEYEEDEEGDEDSHEDDDDEDADCFCALIMDDSHLAFDVEAWTKMNQKIWAAISGKGN